MVYSATGVRGFGVVALWEVCGSEGEMKEMRLIGSNLLNRIALQVVIGREEKKTTARGRR
jgi:hypothetical protein